MRGIWNKFKQSCRKIWDATRPARRWIAKVVRECVEVIVKELVKDFIEDTVAA